MNFSRTTYIICGVTIIWTVLSSCSGPNNDEDPVDPEALFVHEIKPLLDAKCMACHGDDPGEIEGGLDIRTLEGLLQGGESGFPALVPGEPANSPMYFAVTRLDPDFSMPPKDNDKLSHEQIYSLFQWIKHGAPWPDSARQEAILASGSWDYKDGIQVQTSEARSESWARRRYKQEDLWAFQPLTKPEPPVMGHEHPVDAFINQKLKQQNLKPAPLADKRTLIRRATFDLTGLPPAPEEVEAFIHDQSQDAWEKLIDRLLQSPHYGEQWGRHWLDVVRYADTDGFSNDYSRPNAWRYRDYVIRFFNENKPYDQFVREQIAGDEINPDDPEMLIATGFLRMGPWEHTAMSVAAETRQFFLDDVTNSVGETFLSTPLRCARCHDHKFDPIPTKDYYQIQAVFATTQFAEREAPFLPEENRIYMEEEKAQIMAWIKQANVEQDSLQEKEENAARQWYAKHGGQYLPKRQRMKLPEDQRPPRYYGLTYQDLGYRKVLNKRLQTLKRELGRFEPWAFSVYNGPDREVRSAGKMSVPENLNGEPAQTFILTGGSVYTPEEPVNPGIMSAIPALNSDPDLREKLSQEIPLDMTNRRRMLAEWLTQPEHPIVSRSIVNRIWQYHFGKGIAENANNFGATGKKPTHPELLDWLANYFVEQGWSIKTMHRLIMTSEAYQRSGQHPAIKTLQEQDPDNKWLAIYSPRRLEAEELRDAMLKVSGELNPESGGIPVRPEIHQEVALQPRHIMGSIARAYQPSPLPEQRNRRTIYTERIRSLPNPMLEVFNQPGPDLSCERRTASTVTPQVFTLFNGQDTRGRALALAHELMQYDSWDKRIRQAYLRTFCREVSGQELLKSLQYLEEMIAYHREHAPVRQEYPTKVKRRMFEEMTGEPFEYTEKLDVYEHYSPDIKPWDVIPETRALGDLCHVLFNTNEFIYVY